MGRPSEPENSAARRSLTEAADILSEFRLVAGIPPPRAENASRSPSLDGPGAREALERACARIRDLEGELADSRRALEAAAEEKRRLLGVVEKEAGRAADAEIQRAHAAAGEARAAALRERQALLEAELVRQESLRRGAERAAAEAEAAGRAVEEDLRRELRAAATAAERAAAEAASAQSRAKTEIEALRSRLDSAVTRLQSLEQAKRLERARGAGDLEAGQTELLRAQAAAAVLRQELSAARESARSSMELALRDGPPPPAAPLLPALEACLSAWEERFRRADVEVAREWSVPLPDAPHEPKAFVVILRHVLRNVLESVPRGGRLTVRALRGRDGGLRVEFADDGPGFPAGWLARPFQAGASGESVRAGLGLRLVRLALRRWGGNVEAFNAVSGRGARLVLSFAPPSA